jgi:hypothetical protein
VLGVHSGAAARTPSSSFYEQVIAPSGVCVVLPQVAQETFRALVLSMRSCVAERPAAAGGWRSIGDSVKGRGSGTLSSPLSLSPERGRGRDGHCWPPPAQTRTCGITAYGSYRGYMASKLDAPRLLPGTRVSRSVSGTC